MAIIRNALNLNGQSKRELAENHNIGYSTLQKWLKAFRAQKGITNTHSSKERYTAEQRFEHLIATKKRELHRKDKALAETSA